MADSLCPRMAGTIDANANDDRLPFANSIGFNQNASKLSVRRSNRSLGHLMDNDRIDRGTLIRYGIVDGERSHKAQFGAVRRTAEIRQQQAGEEISWH